MHDVQQANNEIQKYPKHILDVLTIEGYIAKWIQFKSEYGNSEEGWEAVERFYVRYFGIKKYSSYDSFRKCMKDHHKKKANDSK